MDEKSQPEQPGRWSKSRSTHVVQCEQTFTPRPALTSQVFIHLLGARQQLTVSPSPTGHMDGHGRPFIIGLQRRVSLH